MEYAIKVLNEKKEQLDKVYHNCVINGNVDSNSDAAEQHREKIQDLENALILLYEHLLVRP